MKLMLESFTIRNFQGLERLDVDVDPLVTCIVGETDSGKSALLRAIRWWALNDRRGDKFIRRGASGCLVAGSVDGRDITRRKGKGVNEYKVDEEVLSFGVGESAVVPPMAAEILRLSSLNFAKQHDPPFWFADTAGQVSKQLNAIVDLRVIDDVLSKAGKEVNRLKTEKTLRENDLLKAEAAKADTEWVADFGAAVVALEELQYDINALADEERALEEALAEAARLRKAAAATAPDMAALAALAADIADLEKQEEELTVLLGVIAGNSEMLARMRKEAKAIEAELKRKLDGQCPVCGGEWTSEGT